MINFTTRNISLALLIISVSYYILNMAILFRANLKQKIKMNGFFRASYKIVHMKNICSVIFNENEKKVIYNFYNKSSLEAEFSNKEAAYDEFLKAVKEIKR